MQRFILSQNIRHFEAVIAGSSDRGDDPVLRTLLAQARRELALLDATERGAGSLDIIGPADVLRRRDWGAATAFEASGGNRLLIDAGPGLHIVDLTAGYAEVTEVSAQAVVGERLFDVFPDNPDDPRADGVSNLYASLQRVVQTRRPHTMAIQRYDVRDAAGKFRERYWRPVNSPIFDPTGALSRVVHEAEDVTVQVLRGFGEPGADGLEPRSASL